MELFENKTNCCGCTACMNICPKKAITMQEDNEGFLYPVIDEKKCIQCGLCEKVCAFQNGSSISERLDQICVYAAKNKSDDLRLKSSSGGMFLTISDYILENKGVIYGVAFDKNLKAQHIRAEKEVDRNRCLGSKYSQSELNDIFKLVKQDLEKGKLVLFTGTPCQVAGLNSFLSNTNRDNLILVDIVCHGTPSPKLFQEYIHYMEKKRKSKVKEFYHRAKDFGWRVHNEKVVYENNKSDNKSNLSQAWKYIFFSHFALRSACYNCPYTNTKRISDITIADFWGIEKFAPEFADKKGVSLVITNTKKGSEIFENIKENIKYIERNIEEAKEKNPNLVKPTECPDNREKFWEEYEQNGIEYILKKYGRYNFKCITRDYIKRMLNKIGLLEVLKKIIKK